MKNIQIKLLGFFVLEVTARSAADRFGIQVNTVLLFYQKIRQVIFWHLEQESQQLFEGKIALDESCFGGIRKGKKGRGAVGKGVVFGILKRQGKVFTTVVGDTKTRTLMTIISSEIKPDSLVYTDYCRSYNALDVSRFQT